jgi:hypothetical protein
LTSHVKIGFIFDKSIGLNLDTPTGF